MSGPEQSIFKALIEGYQASQIDAVRSASLQFVIYLKSNHFVRSTSYVFLNFRPFHGGGHRQNIHIHDNRSLVDALPWYVT